MPTVATRRTNGKIRFKKRHDLTVERGEKPTLPNRKTLAKNLLEAAGQAVKKGFKPRSKEDQEKCLQVCHKCEFYIKSQDRCGKCGCYLSWKTKLRAWNCPEGKW